MMRFLLIATCGFIFNLVNAAEVKFNSVERLDNYSNNLQKLLEVGGQFEYSYFPVGDEKKSVLTTVLFMKGKNFIFIKKNYNAEGKQESVVNGLVDSKFFLFSSAKPILYIAKTANVAFNSNPVSIPLLDPVQFLIVKVKGKEEKSILSLPEVLPLLSLDYFIFPQPGTVSNEKIDETFFSFKTVIDVENAGKNKVKFPQIGFYGEGGGRIIRIEMDIPWYNRGMKFIFNPDITNYKMVKEYEYLDENNCYFPSEIKTSSIGNGKKDPFGVMRLTSHKIDISDDIIFKEYEKIVSESKSIFNVDVGVYVDE